jgi:hypothetical protein
MSVYANEWYHNKIGIRGIRNSVMVQDRTHHAWAYVGLPEQVLATSFCAMLVTRGTCPQL